MLDDCYTRINLFDKFVHVDETFLLLVNQNYSLEFFNSRKKTDIYDAPVSVIPDSGGPLWWAMEVRSEKCKPFCKGLKTNLEQRIVSPPRACHASRKL